MFGSPLAAMYLWMNRPRSEKPLRGGALAPELDARLERMEQAIQAIAIETERIAEGQRFTTKLLSERAATDAPLLQSGQRQQR